MFHPMALTVVLALVAALVLSRHVRAGGGRAVRARQGRRARERRHARRAHASTRRCCAAALRVRVAAVAGAVALVALSGCAGDTPGQRVHPEPRRRRHRAARAAHPRHRPRRRPIGMQRTLDARLAQFPEVDRVFAKHRHGRDRHRPDAAVRRRHLRHPEAARAVARSRASRRARSSQSSKPRRHACPATTTSSRSRSRCASTS